MARKRASKAGTAARPGKKAAAKRRRNGLLDFLGMKPKRKSPTEAAYQKGFAAGSKTAAPAAAPASSGGGLFSNPKKKAAKKKTAVKKRRRNGLAESLAMGAAAGLASVTAQKMFASKKNPGKRKARKRNSGDADGLDAAAGLAAKFYGRPAGQVREVYETVHEHEVLTDLGRLVAVTVQPFDAAPYEIEFESKRTRLAASPSGRQLFVILSEAFPLDSIPVVDAENESIALGWLVSVVYEAKKAHLDNELVNYEHVFGDRGESRPEAESIAEYPVLAYDRLSNRLMVAGGAYHISSPGVVG